MHAAFENKSNTLLQHVDQLHGIKVFEVSREKMHLRIHRHLARSSKGSGTIASCNKIKNE